MEKNTNIVSNQQAGKKRKGRQKIEMKKIEDEESRIVTFSKRKAGIYKKLSEVVTMCGAEVAFVIFSPSGNPFTFAQPSVETVMNRFLGPDNGDDPDPETRRLFEASRKMRSNALVQHYSQMQSRLDTEQERSKTLESKGKYIPKGWWDAPISHMNWDQLHQTCDLFMAVREKALKTISERNFDAIGASSLSSSTQVMNPMALGTNPLAPSFGDTPLGTNYFRPFGSEFVPANSFFVPPSFNGNGVNPTMDFSIPINQNLGTARFMDYSSLATPQVGASSSSATPQVMNPMELGTNPLAPSFGHTPLRTNYFGLDECEFDPTNCLFVPPSFNGNDVNSTMNFSIPIDEFFMDYSSLAGASKVASLITDFFAAFGTNRSASPSPNVAFPPSFGFEGNKQP